MTTSHRMLFWIFLPALIFLAAFHAVSSGSASAPAGTATVSPTPTRLPSPTPNLPPAGASAYRLKSWKESNVDSVIALVNHDQEKLKELEFDSSYEWYSYSIYESRDFDQTAITLLRESLLRFPDSAEQDSWDKQLLNRLLASRDANSFEMLGSRIEEALNTDSEIYADLSGWLQTNYPEVALASSQNVNDLFGSGNQGQLIKLDVNTYMSGLLGIQIDTLGKYHVYPITKTWQSIIQENWTVTTDDLNGDGTPEIAIQIYFYTIGFTHACTQQIDIYEWNGKSFIDLALNLGFFSSNSDYGNCGGWEYRPGDNGTKILTSKHIQGGLDETPNTFIRNKNYAWNGIQFEWIGKEILPFQNLDDPVAAANWAYEAGPQNEQAFNILKETVIEWPSELEKDWGPAAQDYFRYKLGLWYAFRGDKPNATETLNQVRDHPTHPEFKVTSQMAGAFLQRYSSQGSFAGCSSVIHTLWAEYMSFRNPTFLIYDFDPNQILSTWGLMDAGWGEYYYAFWPMQGRGQEAVICSLAEAFQSSLARAPIHNQAELIDWFTRNQVPWNGLQTADLNGDGLTDWLVMVNTAQPSYRNLWALIQGPSGIKAINIDTLSTPSNSITAYRAFQPAKEAGTFHAYQINQNVLIFHLIQSGEKLAVDIDFTAGYGWPTPHVNINGLLIDVQGQVPEQQLVVQGENGINGILSWDADMHRLKRTLTSLTQANQITQAETALFKNQNPFQAREIIQLLFRKGIQEEMPDVWSHEKFTPRNRPYLQYLLGLTYELTGNQANAVQAYYQLWHDYPYNPYAVIAGEKLERKP